MKPTQCGLDCFGIAPDPTIGKIAISSKSTRKAKSAIKLLRPRSIAQNVANYEPEPELPVSLPPQDQRMVDMVQDFKQQLALVRV